MYKDASSAFGGVAAKASPPAAAKTPTTDADMAPSADLKTGLKLLYLIEKKLAKQCPPLRDAPDLCAYTRLYDLLEKTLMALDKPCAATSVSCWGVRAGRMDCYGDGIGVQEAMLERSINAIVRDNPGEADANLIAEWDDMVARRFPGRAPLDEDGKPLKPPITLAAVLSIVKGDIQRLIKPSLSSPSRAP